MQGHFMTWAKLFAVLAALLLAAPAFGQDSDDADTSDADAASPSRLELWRSPNLSRFVVRDTMAGYFDVPARRALIAETEDPFLRGIAWGLTTLIRCDDYRNLRVIDYRVDLPRYYEGPERWREEARPFHLFERAVSDLAGAFMSGREDRFAECLADLLSLWADRNALMDFAYDERKQQSWYEVEASAIAAAAAYSILKHAPGVTEEQLAKIGEWLQRVSRHHLEFQGGDNSCCNNHYYRRALHASLVGVTTGDDALFQYGIEAYLRALFEMNEDGTLPREIARGDRALHYQNYVLLFLLPIAEITARQGYNLYDLEIEGRSIHDLVRFSVRNLTGTADPSFYGGEEQDLAFLSDPEFFTWTDIYLSRFDDPGVRELAERFRPTYNRRAGGPITLYFLPARSP